VFKFPIFLFSWAYVLLDTLPVSYIAYTEA